MSSKSETKKSSPPTRELSPLERYGFPATLLVLSAAVSSVSQLTMAPIYGAVPSAANHTITLLFAVAVGYGSWVADGAPRRSQHIWIAIYPFWAPVLQNILLPYSKNLGPLTGAMINGAISCHAVLLGSIYALAESLAVFDLTPYVGPRVGDTIKAALLMPAFLGMEKKIAEWIILLMSMSKVLTPVHLQLGLASAFSLYFPSWYVLLGLPAILHTFLMNPHMSTDAANQALGAHNWTLIDRQWSNTGYISVLESTNEDYRALRCDHSLLGGEWIATEQRKKKEGWKVNEPIFSAFEMLEAVRLVQVDTRVPDNEAHALVVGLGIGTAPKALISHGIDTTVIELDPVVHAFATKYFGLPHNHTAVLQDATTWVRDASKDGSKQYDYIIHDVFTGGAEPLPLFNAEFLRNLRSLLKPHGVIALNYAGDLINPLTRSVLHTIDEVFAGQSQCKIFRDGPPQRHSLTEGSHEDFVNMVIFCRNDENQSSSSSSSQARQASPFFRTPRQGDYLDRQSAKHYLLPNSSLELTFPDPSDILEDDPSQAQRDAKALTFISLVEPLRALRDDPLVWTRQAPKTHTHDPYTQVGMDVIRRGDERKYAKQQEESAIRHWYIMRSVIPNAVWEMW